MHTNMAVKLVNNLGIEYEFISMSRASQFLGRNNGYISTKLRRNYTEVTDIHGNKYKIEKLI